MTAATGLRADFDGKGLRKLPRQVKDGGQARRLLAAGGDSRRRFTQNAARIGSVTIQSICD